MGSSPWSQGCYYLHAHMPPWWPRSTGKPDMCLPRAEAASKDLGWEAGEAGSERLTYRWALSALCPWKGGRVGWVGLQKRTRKKYEKAKGRPRAVLRSLLTSAAWYKEVSSSGLSPNENSSYSNSFTDSHSCLKLWLTTSSVSEPRPTSSLPLADAPGEQRSRAILWKM